MARLDDLLKEFTSIEVWRSSSLTIHWLSGEDTKRVQKMYWWQAKRVKTKEWGTYYTLESGKRPREVTIFTSDNILEDGE